MNSKIKVLVLNGSPTGENSITLCTVKYIQALFPACTFDTLHVGQKIRHYEDTFDQLIPQLEAADLILFCYPVYTFLVPAQLHRFIELIKERGVDLTGKYATQITTSKHFYDITAHRFIEDNCHDLGMRVLHGLSADMDDLLTEKGQREAKDFFAYVVWCMQRGCFEPRPRLCAQENLPLPEIRLQPLQKKPGRVVIVTDSPAKRLQTLIDTFTARLPYETSLVDLHTFPFAGGCLGCFHCASDGTCIYKDGFDRFLRENIQTGDAIVYAFQIRDHSMGSRFKLYDDRQFCNGHRTVTMGKPMAYLVDGCLETEPNLQTVLEARPQVGGNFLAGIATDPLQCLNVADALDYALEQHLQQPQNFYGVGGLKIFRDLIYQMQGLMREDHRFYREHGFYDFPQKRRGRIIGMYFVHFLMTSRFLKKKLGSRMTEGMLMPYNKVLKKVQAANPTVPAAPVPDAADTPMNEPKETTRETETAPDPVPEHAHEQTLITD